MRCVIISQARTGSTRLPRKVLLRVKGRTLLEWHVERLKRCAAATEVVVATTTHAVDNVVVSEAERLGVRWYRGPEDNVLSRFLGAAREARAESVARVTSDCPLWDPGVGAEVIAALARDESVDYASNCLERTYPRGLDTEVLWMDVLERMARSAVPGEGPEREHVTYMIHTTRPTLFVRRSVTDSRSNSDLRWCVDTREDFASVDAVLTGLADPFAPYSEVLRFARAHPEIVRLNANVEQKRT